MHVRDQYNRENCRRLKFFSEQIEGKKFHEQIYSEEYNYSKPLYYVLISILPSLYK